LLELSRDEREIIELVYWSERSRSEVADYAVLPLGTTKMRTRSGRTRLATLPEGEI